MCKTVQSAGQRRGAMMGCMRIDHPDIEAFIDAKRDPARLRNFNLSVLVTDDFMQKLADDADWPLVFGGKLFGTVKAKALWQRLMLSTYDTAEPGVIFIDRVKKNPSFLQYFDPSIAKVRGALARLSDEEDMRWVSGHSSS